MWIDELRYRKNLGINKNLTFGIEIEFDKARKSLINDLLETAYNNNVISNQWKIENDETIYDDSRTYSLRGGDAISDVLTDEKDSWDNIWYTCNKIKSYGGEITSKCGAHVHIGANILKENMVYYERLLKLWSIYENIIIRFCYGEQTYPRKNMTLFALPIHNLIKTLFTIYYDFDKNKFKISQEEFMEKIDYFLGLKSLSLTFKGLNEEYLKTKYKGINDYSKYRTLEFRLGNGTLNPIIWQNYINLYTKILLCCLDDNKDWDMINQKFKESLDDKIARTYDYDKAIELCNFIFENELDKNYFMLQYDKDYKKNKIKARRQTIN